MAWSPLLAAESVAPSSLAAWVQHAKKDVCGKTELVQHRYLNQWRGAAL
ncbi:MAG: hypothetical protein PHI96_06365 [Desulfovibrio sp.]|nr:hypothetical protein [Desulfovibrio sp.]